MRGKTKFEPTMYVTAYELARDGLSDKQVAQSLGVSGATFARWCSSDATLADAVSRGRSLRVPGKELTFHEYVYDHLSPELRGLWDKINECEHLTNARERTEALLAGHGVRVRQHLFLYALTQSMFNVSRSLRKLGISRKCYDNWRTSDPEFHDLMEEIHWYKANFFEQAFIGRVVAGDTLAILHAVKTKCRDRGYNEKIEVEHTGTINHQHTVAVADLDLPVEVRKAVLDALRRHQQADAPPAPLAGRLAAYAVN